MTTTAPIHMTRARTPHPSTALPSPVTLPKFESSLLIAVSPWIALIGSPIPNLTIGAGRGGTRRHVGVVPARSNGVCAGASVRARSSVPSSSTDSVMDIDAPIASMSAAATVETLSVGLTSSTAPTVEGSQSIPRASYTGTSTSRIDSAPPTTSTPPT